MTIATASLPPYLLSAGTWNEIPKGKKMRFIAVMRMMGDTPPL